MTIRLAGLVALACTVTSCASLLARQSPEELAATIVAETQTAAAGEATATPEPSPTSTASPTGSPTFFPSATTPPTSTPLPSGPVTLEDDFSSDVGTWFDCEHCTIENGQLRMGPFPVSHAYQQKWALCGPCGMVSTFRVSVDVRFIGGPSERGFGLILGMDDQDFYTYEITPWQTIDFWRFDYDRGQWDWINGTFVGAVRTGNQVNRISVDAARNSNDRIDYALEVNGRNPIVIFNREVGPGWVGMTLYGHAVELVFDNFSFETEETPTFPASPPSTNSG